jgi:hypothetical protein
VAYLVVITLMLFALVGFAGAGIALAVGRAHELEECETDFGMRAVAVMLLAFGAVCTFVAIGMAGVFAFGGVVAWASYMFAAQRVGVFQLYSGDDHRRSDFLQRNPLGR